MIMIIIIIIIMIIIIIIKIILMIIKIIMIIIRIRIIRIIVTFILQRVSQSKTGFDFRCGTGSISVPAYYY